MAEAEVVTADGKIRIANACTSPDLFWVLKGGGGGTFGIANKLTLRVHELSKFGGGAIFRVKASSHDAFRKAKIAIWSLLCRINPFSVLLELDD
jgi:FAD/FMN-containing dehydrogenase